MQNINGVVKRSATRRARPNIRFRGKNLIEDILFTRSELINLINKSIYFLYKMKQSTFIQNINKTGKKTNVFNISPLYTKLISNIPVIINARHYHTTVPIIKFQYDNIYRCYSHVNCIDDYALDLMKIKLTVVNGINVAYILYNNYVISAIPDEPTFINSLNEKEIAFMKIIFNKANVSTVETFLLNGYEVENISKYLNVIPNKNKTSRLRFSNKVHVKEISNRKTIRKQ
jgi:hypothetical protein